jgi:predicted dehydrogenase
MSDTPPLCIALAGVSNHGATVLRAILDAPSCRLVLCCDADEQALRACAAPAETARTTSFDELLEHPDVEAVALATPNALHAGQILRAAAAGKQVFVEKPLAATLAEARACIAAMERGGLTLLVGHNTRRRGPFRRARQVLDEGAVGTVVGAHAILSRHAGLDSGLPAWKRRPDEHTLLPMTQLGIHFVDVTRYFFGPLASVYCSGWNSAMRDGVIDATAAVLVTAAGPAVTLVSHYTTDEFFEYVVYGTEGTVRCTPVSLFLRRRGEAEREESFAGEGLSSFSSQFDELAVCTRTGARPETDGHAGYAALAAVEAMRESIRTGGSAHIHERCDSDDRPTDTEEHV